VGHTLSQAKEREFAAMLKLIQKILSYPLIWLDTHSHHVVFAYSKKAHHDGFKLYCLSKEKTKKFFETASKALDLMKQIDRRRYRRAMQHVPNIVYAGSGTGYFKPSARAYYVDSFDPNDIVAFAGSVIHEATHGFVMAKGFKYVDEKREQHERMAVAEQFRFIKRAICRDETLSSEEQEKATKKWEIYFDAIVKNRWWEPHLVRERNTNAFKEIFFKNRTIENHYPNGKLKTRMCYRYNLLHGRAQWFYESGALQCEGGQRSGEGARIMEMVP